MRNKRNRRIPYNKFKFDKVERIMSYRSQVALMQIVLILLIKRKTNPKFFKHQQIKKSIITLRQKTPLRIPRILGSLPQKKIGEPGLRENSKNLSHR